MPTDPKPDASLGCADASRLGSAETIDYEGMARIAVACLTPDWTDEDRKPFIDDFASDLRRVADATREQDAEIADLAGSGIAAVIAAAIRARKGKP